MRRRAAAAAAADEDDDEASELQTGSESKSSGEEKDNPFVTDEAFI